MTAAGLTQREIARRLGINRRTVARLARSDEPPRYRRGRTGSQLDPVEPVIRELLAEWPQLKAPRLTRILRADYGHAGSVELFRLHLRRLRPRSFRVAQRTGYRPGQVMQLDWAELPTRPKPTLADYDALLGRGGQHNERERADRGARIGGRAAHRRAAVGAIREGAEAVACRAPAAEVTAPDAVSVTSEAAAAGKTERGRSTPVPVNECEPEPAAVAASSVMVAGATTSLADP